MSGSAVAIVLVEPREPGNIGAAARAMGNMGLDRLVLVNPADHLSPAARRMAPGAGAILEGATVCATLAEAISGFGIVVGTTRREGRVRSGKISPRAAAPRIVELSKANDVAVLFGREDRGLTNREIEKCQRIVTVPTAPKGESLNLAQAVLVVAYELFLAGHEHGEALEKEPLRKLASSGSLEEMYGHMERVLLEIDYLKENNPKRMMRAFRKIFGRAGLGDGDVRALRGVFHQVEWYARSGRGGKRAVDKSSASDI